MLSFPHSVNAHINIKTDLGCFALTNLSPKTLKYNTLNSDSSALFITVILNFSLWAIDNMFPENIEIFS